MVEKIFTKNISNFSILIIFILIFTGNIAFCDVINGRVIDERGFPVPGVAISITNGGSVTANFDGYFQIATEKLPYDLMITDASNSTGVLYRGININNPELVMFGDYPPRNVNSEAIKVEFPPIPRDRSAIIKFISNDLFYSEEVTAFTNEKSKTITVSWSQSSNMLSGKIIYLEKSSTTFEKFSEKSYTIIKDFYPQFVKFDTLTTYTKPEESNITVYLPTVTYNKVGFKVSGDFMSLHRNSGINFNTIEGNIIFSKCIVPMSIPYGFRLKVEGYGYNIDGSGFTNTTYTSPNSVLNIASETPPKLTAPQDKFWGVSSSTEFGYEWGSGSGVYVIYFHCFNPSADFYVVTKEKFINSPFNYAGRILTGEEYSWKTFKYLTYITMDEFVRPKKFLNDVGYKAITESETRTFRKKMY